MAPSHLSKVFRDISCFYMFTVLGIEENLLSELDQHQSSMRRMEFCWLIDVQPPRLEGASATGAVLSWREVKFCGFHLPESFIQEAGMGVMYELEISEAHAYRTGIGSKFASDASASDYLVVCSRSQAGSVAVVDLEPATWYHARIAVAYNGTRFYSLVRSAAVCSMRAHKSFRYHSPLLCVRLAIIGFSSKNIIMHRANPFIPSPLTPYSRSLFTPNSLCPLRRLDRDCKFCLKCLLLILMRSAHRAHCCPGPCPQALV